MDRPVYDRNSFIFDLNLFKIDWMQIRLTGHEFCRPCMERGNWGSLSWIRMVRNWWSVAELPVVIVVAPDWKLRRAPSRRRPIGSAATNSTPGTRIMHRNWSIWELWSNQSCKDSALYLYCICCYDLDHYLSIVGSMLFCLQLMIGIWILGENLLFCSYSRVFVGIQYFYLKAW